MEVNSFVSAYDELLFGVNLVIRPRVNMINHRYWELIIHSD